MESDGAKGKITAQGTVEHIRQQLVSGKVPVVSQVLELIRTITQKAATISVQQLADLIAQDPEVMVRIIGVANRLAYNPSGTEIATIQQAISIIGYERIRNLSISVMLMENAESELSGEERRELAGIALASGFLARELFLPLAGLDPEVAFVCAALRNYGKLLLTTFLPDEYTRARVLTRTHGESRAFHEVFGLTPLELGRELLEGAQLPPMILDTMRDADREALQQQTVSPLQQLTAISEFSVRLFETLSESGTTPETFEATASQLANEWLPNLQLSPTLIADHLQQVGHRCHEIAGGAGLDSLRTPLFRRIVAIAEGRPLPPAAALSRRISSQSTTFAVRESAIQAFHSGGLQLADLLEQSPPDIPHFFGELVQLLHRHLCLRETVVFLVQLDGRTAVACYGLGEVFTAIAQRKNVSSQERDVFGLCLSRGEDIVLENISNPRLRAFIPPWLLNVAPDHPAVLLALKDDKGTFGLVLCVGRDRAAFKLFEGTRTELGQLRTSLPRLGEHVRRHFGNPPTGDCPTPKVMER